MQKQQYAPGSASLEIESNQINISNRKNSAFFIYLCKQTLVKYDEIVLHAIGNASTTSLNTAQGLVTNGYADFIKVETKTIQIDRRYADDQDQPREVKRAKLFIHLQKSKTFDAQMEKFNLIKVENEKHILAERLENLPSLKFTLVSPKSNVLHESLMRISNFRTVIKALQNVSQI